MGCFVLLICLFALINNDSLWPCVNGAAKEYIRRYIVLKRQIQP